MIKINHILNKESLPVYSLYLFFFLLPYDTNILSISIMLMIVAAAVDFNKYSSVKLEPTQWWFLVSCCSLFLLYFFSFFQSDNKAEAMGIAERKLSLIAFPLFFILYKDKLTNSLLKKCLKIFTLSLGMVCIGLFFYWIYKTMNDSSFAFFKENITAVLDFHRVYFSLYLFGGVVFIIEEKIFNHWSFIRNILLLIFLLFIVLISSRLFVALAFFYVSFKGLQYIRNNSGQLIMKMTLVIILLAFASAVMYVPFLREQYSHFFINVEKGKELELTNGVNLRLVEWECAGKIIRNNWLLGVSTGDAMETMIDCYRNMNFHYGVDLKFNAHNQYLQNWMSLGILGLLNTCIISLLFIIISIKKKNIVLLWLSIALLLFFNTECVIDRQAGILFVLGVAGIFLFIKNPIPNV